jgi:hypothetical protein
MTTRSAEDPDVLGGDRERLWVLAVPPAIWAAHFMLAYLTAAIWCAKAAERTVSIDGVRTAIAAYTVLALAGIAAIGWVGYRRHQHGNEALPHDLDTPGDRHRFLGFATLLLASLSAVATLYASFVAIFFRTCS